MGLFVAHEPCPACKSSDGLARYADNSAHCFVCSHNIKGDGTPVEASDDTFTKDWKPVQGVYKEGRGLKEETFRRAKYEIGEYNGETAHIMNVFDGGKLIAQKFRTKESKGSWIGDAKDPPFYLQWLFPAGGRSITITEGELDALSVFEAFGYKWPAVSLPNGTGSVKKAITKWYDYLDSFSKIVLMFDNDEPGQKAVEDAVELLPPGKVYIATLPEKDANDTIRKHGPHVIVSAFHQAALYRPDGIISGTEITLEELMTEADAGYTLPYPKVQEMLLGLRKGELTLLTAGSGIGKSTLAREWGYLLHQQHGLRIGNVFLEEGQVKTAQGYVALHTGVPLGRLRHDKKIITADQWQDAHTNVISSGRLFFYKHFGSLESDRLISKLRYLAKVDKCDFIILDHISIVTSGLESGSEGERKDIDILMTKLRALVEETGVGIVAIVHLKRVNGKVFNEGAQISLSDLRGSASLEQLSDNVIALERDQQSEGDKKRRSLIRVLKTREGEDTGEADYLIYDKQTGRNELAPPFEETDEASKGANEPFKF
jgi:twinkle protein